MTDKNVRISSEHWERLRTAAFYKCSHIKTLLDAILSGEVDPVTLEQRAN